MVSNTGTSGIVLQRSSNTLPFGDALFVFDFIMYWLADVLPDKGACLYNGLAEAWLTAWSFISF